VDNVLVDAIRSSLWMMRLLRTVRDAAIADAWIGAGALRDLIWDERYGSGFRPERVHDVDVAYFNPDDLSRARDDQTTEHLARRLAGVPWEAKNQAAVHLWYRRKFGGDPVEPLTSIRDAVGTWPETATAVAARLTVTDTIEICAPLGLDDLLHGIWRRNPRRISIEQSLARLNRHAPGERWPRVTVVAPA
jgi:hypothetical protein